MNTLHAAPAALFSHSIGKTCRSVELTGEIVLDGSVKVCEDSDICGLVTRGSYRISEHVSPHRRAGLTMLMGVRFCGPVMRQPSLSPFTYEGFCLGGHFLMANAQAGVHIAALGPTRPAETERESPSGRSAPAAIKKCLRVVLPVRARQQMGLHGLHSGNTEGYARADLRKLATSKGARWRASTEQTTNDSSKGDVRDVGTYVQWTHLL